MSCKQCRDNRRRKVGEKLENVTRREGSVFCTDCGRLVGTSYDSGRDIYTHPAKE